MQKRYTWPLTIAPFCLHVHNQLIQMIAFLVLTVLSHFSNPCNDFHPLLYENKPHTCTHGLLSSKSVSQPQHILVGVTAMTVCQQRLKLPAFTVECHDNHSVMLFIFHDSWVQLFPSETFSSTDHRCESVFFFLLNQPFSLKIVETFD